jgi:metallo-beta-lactamase family protein
MLVRDKPQISAQSLRLQRIFALRAIGYNARVAATITFYGGTGAVTGANFLLDTGDKKILVDCGAFEREHVCDPGNTAPFAYDPASIDALVVTHAHQDHIGRIPRLVRHGFRGSIYSTAATKDLSAVMLRDALSLMTSGATHAHCESLYDEHDLEQALQQWTGRGYHEPFSLGTMATEFLNAGHVLGSATIRFSRGGRSILFTGDLGNAPEPLLNDAENPAGANYMVIESVYGDRVHEQRAERAEALRAAIEATRERGGTLLIPSFSLERTQILLYELNAMMEEGRMQPISVYLDAPLATRVTDVFRQYLDSMNAAVRGRAERGDDPFSFPGLTVIEGPVQSQAIHEMPGAKVIIAGAGMSVGGRIRGHEKRYLPDKTASVLFVGYQAPGSLGRRIQDGARSVDIDGERVAIRAQIDTLTGYSGHADRDQLVAFVEAAGASLSRVFVTMGEPKASSFLSQRLRDFLGVEVVVPEPGQSFTIDV